MEYNTIIIYRNITVSPTTFFSRPMDRNYIKLVIMFKTFGNRLIISQKVRPLLI